MQIQIFGQVGFIGGNVFDARLKRERKTSGRNQKKTPIAGILIFFAKK